MTMTASMKAAERALLEVYNPIREKLDPWDCAWIDEALAMGTQAEIEDAFRFCRTRIDEIEWIHKEKEA